MLLLLPKLPPRHFSAFCTADAVDTQETLIINPTDGQIANSRMVLKYFPFLASLYSTRHYDHSLLKGVSTLFCDALLRPLPFLAAPAESRLWLLFCPCLLTLSLPCPH